MARDAAITLNDLVRVGKGTPGGEWLRRYWLAVARSEDLRDVPQAIRLLGEDLVLFRDPAGQPGLLGLACPHRGTSLEYGDVEDGGLRCPYHGWLFDVTGQCLEQPAEPKGSTFYQRVRHLAYPVRALGGLLFAYLGPDGDDPPLPRYAPLVEPGGQRQVEPVRHLAYNWFNFWENSADPCHISVLHRTSAYGAHTWGSQFFDYRDMPAFEPVERDYGLTIVMRKPGPTPDTETVDEMSLALPSTIQIGDTELVHLGLEEVAAAGGAHNAHLMFLTPNDDDHFMLFTVDHYTGPEPDFFAKLKQIRAREVPREAIKPYDQRKLMPFRGSVRDEDVVTQSTQRLLGERSERLATSDRGVIALRHLAREAVEAVQRGERPRGVLAPEQADRIVRLDTFVGVRPKAVEVGR
ncbi:MAG TPA: Rieske 2Fe-2S domain-containing protein [Chloroflexota bacterium]|jgi:phenylpropionate dioxygenase-like ring-hydroxylating dioxygenase large terminal subunit